MSKRAIQNCVIKSSNMAAIQYIVYTNLNLVSRKKRHGDSFRYVVRTLQLVKRGEALHFLNCAPQVRGLTRLCRCEFSGVTADVEAEN